MKSLRGWKQVRLLVLGFGAALLAGCSGGDKVENVVLIIVDTLRADAILDPDGQYTTPNIDSLAADGVQFTAAFTHAPMTLPAHTALFSSRIPRDTGILNNGQQVPDDLPLFAEWIAGAGYDTRGVISLGTLQNQGLHRGFADFDEKIWHQAPAEDVAERVRAVLAERDETKPLFFFAHFSDPHSPYHSHGDLKRRAGVRVNEEKLTSVDLTTMDIRAGKVELQPGRNVFEFTSRVGFRVKSFVLWEKGERLEMEWVKGERGRPGKAFRVFVDRPEDAEVVQADMRLWMADNPRPKEIPKRYAIEVEYVDQYVGAVIDELKREGLYDDSLILFTSDHGEALGEHDYFGHVRYLTDETIQVPLIVKLPEKHSARKKLADRKDVVVRHLDLVPTILALAEIMPLPGQQGVDFLREDPPPHLAQTHKPESLQDKICLRDEEYKLIYVADEDRFLMYDLERDPGELEDVYDERGSEREDWTYVLRAVADHAAGRGDLEVDEETRQKLEALGYAGNEN